MYCSYLIHQLVSAAASLSLSSCMCIALPALVFPSTGSKSIDFFSSPLPVRCTRPFAFCPATHTTTLEQHLSMLPRNHKRALTPPLSIYPSFKRSCTLLLGSLSLLLIHVLLDYSRLPLRACYTVRNVFSYKTRSIRMSPFGGKDTTRTPVLLHYSTLYHIIHLIDTGEKGNHQQQQK